MIKMTMTNQKIDRRKILRRKLEKHRKLQKISSSLYIKYCNLTGSLHVLPDFLIIGFVKCGTTSLYEYLMLHPNVYPPKGKEIDYFDRLYNNGPNWYKNSFPLKIKKYFLKNIFNKEFLTGEATPRYIEHPHTLQRIKSFIPNAKFIVLLRNPIDRAFSHYKMNLRNEYEYLSFEDAIKNEQQRIKGRHEKMSKNENYYSWDYDIYGYLEHGIYVNKLKTWMEVFPKEQFLIIQSEDFMENPSEVYKKSLKFLKLPSWNLNEYKQFKKSTQKEIQIDPSFRKQLKDYFKPYNDQLYQFLGINYHWNE